MESENKNAPGFTPTQAIWLAQHGVNVQELSLKTFAGPGEGYAQAKRAEKDLPTLAEEHLKAVDQRRANAAFEAERERWKAEGGRHIMQPTGKAGEAERVWQKYNDIPANEPAKPTFKPGGVLSNIPEGQYQHLTKRFENREDRDAYQQRMKETAHIAKSHLVFVDEAHAGPTKDQLKEYRDPFEKRAPHSNAHNDPETFDKIKSMPPGEERDQKEEDFYTGQEKHFARQLLNSIVENFPGQYMAQGRIIEILEQIILAEWSELKAKRQEDVKKTESDLDTLNAALEEYGE